MLLVLLCVCCPDSLLGLPPNCEVFSDQTFSICSFVCSSSPCNITFNPTLVTGNHSELVKLKTHLSTVCDGNYNVWLSIYTHLTVSQSQFETTFKQISCDQQVLANFHTKYNIRDNY